MRKVVFGFALLLALVGCGVTKSDLVGDYEGTFQLTEEQKKDPATAFLDGLKPKLTLKEDDTFILDLMVKTEGKWRFEKTKIFLTPTSVMGIAIPDSQKKEIEFVIEGKGNILKGVSPDGNVPLMFTKSGS